MHDSRLRGELTRSATLVFPPVWDVAAPYLAGPALAAFVRSQGHGLDLLDANQLFWTHFRSPRQAATIRRNCEALRFDPGLQLDESVVASFALSLLETDFPRWLAGASLSSPVYRLLVRRFGGFWHAGAMCGQNTLDYHDGLFSDVSQSSCTLHEDNLRACLAEPDNPWRRFAREEVLPRLTHPTPRLLGLTILAANQVVPAFAIATEIRKIDHLLPVLIGGSWVTQLRHQIQRSPWLAELGFVFVPFEGETALAEYVGTASSVTDTRSSSLRSLPVYGGLRTPTHLPLSKLPTPDFSGLPLDEYGAPRRLPLMASRGCYWGKCNFCSYPILEPKYEVRPQDLLALDIRELVARYGAEHIAFVDPSISVSLAKHISRTVREGRLPVTWGGLARLERGFTRTVLADMADNGCVVVHWGLESGSQRMQDELRKGVTIEAASRVLQEAADLGIHNRVLMMYGIPDETEAELQMSLDFIESHLPAIGSIVWSRYTPEIGTPIGEDMLDRDTTLLPEGALAVGLPREEGVSPAVLSNAEEQMAKLAARVLVNAPTAARTTSHAPPAGTTS